MTAVSEVGAHAVALLVWGLLASAVMATLLEGAQLTGLTRMSFPFLFGTAVSGDRRSALILGYVFYLFGGLLFAVLYALCLVTLEVDGLWEGALAGLVLGVAHGLFLVIVFLPLLPYVHPRLVTDYDGAGTLPRLEPPGPFGLNYGRATPLATVTAQALFGLIFGLGYGAAIGAG